MLSAAEVEILSSIPEWGVGAICSLIPVTLAVVRKQWLVALLTLGICILAGMIGSWIMAAWCTLILFLFVLISPSNGTGSVTLIVIVGMAAIMAYAIELRIPELYRKSGLPSLVKLVGDPDRESGREPVSNREWRVFTAPDGRTMTARVEEVDGDQVTIERKDGQRFTTRFYRFSEEDQVYFQSLAESP